MTKKLTLIKRTVPACPGCTMQEKALESGGVPFKSIDITHYPEAVEKYGIASIPVMIIEDADGNEIERVSGFSQAEVVADLLR